MSKKVAVLITIICFMIGLAIGMSHSNTSLSVQMENEIKQYEASLETTEQVFVPLSERNEAELMVVEELIEHNQISRMGKEIGELLKTAVRECLRYAIIAVDYFISS